MNGNAFDLFRSHWAVAPDREFLVPSTGPARTYRQIDDRSACFATVLRARNVSPGDRVVTQLAKTTDAIAVYLACLRIGAIYVPLNTNYTDTEVAYFVDDAQPQVTIRQSDIGELAMEADSAEPWTRVETRLADDLAAMIYTSGTTGRSKGAMVTHANIASNALALHAIWRFTPGDVLLHVLPIYHVHGLFVALHTAMLNASTVLFCDRFETKEVLELMPQATVMMGVPTHYVRLLADPDFGAAAAEGMRLFTSGSAPMTAAVHEEFTTRTGHRILERYGMSECGMITSNPYDGDRVPGTVGFALPRVQVRVMNDQGLCEPGEIGVVETKGPHVFAGYWRQDEKTEQSFNGEWFITGDVGSVDEQDRLTLEGRAGDMIISGGLNIYPKEVELALDSHPEIRESAVIGVDDEEFGQVAVACVVLADSDDEFDPDRIVESLKRDLASFKIPKRFEVLGLLPRNSMGKVQKSHLRFEN